jgi:hypothetical protein
MGLGFLKYGNIWEQHSTIKIACKDLIVFSIQGLLATFCPIILRVTEEDIWAQEG